MRFLRLTRYDDEEPTQELVNPAQILFVWSRTYKGEQRTVIDFNGGHIDVRESIEDIAKQLEELG